MGVNSVSNNSGNNGVYSAGSFTPDPNITKYADQQFAKGTDGSQWYKDYYEKNPGQAAKEGLSPEAAAKSAFEGFEQWINHEAMKLMDQCASDMGNNNG